MIAKRERRCSVSNIPGNVFLAALLAIAFELAGTQPGRCGAWPMPAGKGQSISTLTWQSASVGFDQNGRARPDLHFEKFESAVFFEYGLTSQWTLVARPAAQTVHLRTGSTVDQAQGFAASELSLRRALPGPGHWVLAVQAGLFIPGNVENGFDKPLGESGLDQELRLLAGHAFKWRGRDGFVDIQGAYRQRSRGSGDEWRLDVTAGAMLSSHVQLLAQSFAIIGRPSRRPGFRTVDSLKGQLGGVWFYQQNRGLQLSLSRTLYGRNVVRDTGLSIGWWRRF